MTVWHIVALSLLVIAFILAYRHFHAMSNATRFKRVVAFIVILFAMVVASAVFNTPDLTV